MVSGPQGGHNLDPTSGVTNPPGRATGAVRSSGPRILPDSGPLSLEEEAGRALLEGKRPYTFLFSWEVDESAGMKMVGDSTRSSGGLYHPCLHLQVGSSIHGGA